MLNDHRGFDVSGTRGSRIGAPTRGAIRIGLCLVLLAGVAAACGSSKSTGQGGQPSVAPAASAQGTSTQGATTQAPAVSFDPAEYANDSGGFGTNGSIEDYGYTDRYQGTDGLDHMAGAYALISQALPTAVDLNQTQAQEPGMVSEDVYIQWEPLGRRDTALPPGNHGERIYEADIDLGPYLKGGDAVAYVWFISRAEAASLDPNDLTATPNPYPTKAYSFKIDKATAAALLDMFWVKGAAPTETSAPAEAASPTI